MTLAVPETVPTVAVIVATPFSTADTNPEASTVATLGALLDHITATSVISWPLWS